MSSPRSPDSPTGEQPQEPVGSRATPQTAPSAGLVPAIEAASEESDDNYWSDSASDLTSLSSSVAHYVYENGRTYHAYQQGKYVLPNDDTEQDRLDLVHHIFMILLRGQYHLSPLNQPQNILDLGTGTGIWALDVADMYPSAKVIGNDLSPIQPSFVSPNVEFVIEDFEEEWVYPENKFDLIHGRTLSGSVGDWPALFRKAYKHVKPGGWFELHEAAIWSWSDDDSIKPDSPLLQFLSMLESTSSKDGRSFNVCENLQPWMVEAGFEDVHLSVYKVPWGPWPKDPHLKEIGRYQYVNCLESVDSYGLALMTRAMKYSEEEAKIFLAIVKDQLRSKSLHAYNLTYVIYGRKPLQP